MAISKVNNATWANLAEVDNVAKANIAKIQSVSAPVSFADSYAVSKGLATGSSHYIRTTVPADSPINFTESSAFTISFWVKAGWNTSLNTGIYFMTLQPSAATGSYHDLITIYYDDRYNRLTFLIYNNPGGGNYRYYAAWLFHANSGIYAAGYAAAGCGTTYWNSGNRGNVGDNDFTMITVSKSTSTNPTGARFYWNGTAVGAPPVTACASCASLGFETDEERELCIGSHVAWTAATYDKTGNNTETQYNDFAIWDKQLTDAEVAAVYNSGTRMDLTSDSGNYASSADLQVYYEFENNGTANTDADLSGTDYDLTVAGDSNFESL